MESFRFSLLITQLHYHISSIFSFAFENVLHENFFLPFSSSIVIIQIILHTSDKTRWDTGKKSGQVVRGGWRLKKLMTTGKNYIRFDLSLVLIKVQILNFLLRLKLFFKPSFILINLKIFFTELFSSNFLPQSSKQKTGRNFHINKT